VGTRFTILAVALCAGVAQAQNESDWQPFFAVRGTTFYYAPSTVRRDGDLRSVKWHDSLNPQVVFLMRIDCKARTIQSLSVDQYDLNTGAYYASQDLSANSQPEPIEGPATMGAKLAEIVC